jgi:hypothetical protein
MKRSEVNRILVDSIAFLRGMNFQLPPFAFYSVAQWRQVKQDAREILDLGLGWDITDFGSGDFQNIGLTLFTLRNGRRDSADYPKPYAEKIMISGHRQVTPMHFHWHKTEDIIVRGQGRLAMELHWADEREELGQQPVTVSIDGMRRTFAAGETVVLGPGEGICLPPRLYHRFYSLDGNCLLGEVSQVNDDFTDNRFLEPAGRFPQIEEDEPPQFLLCSDYAKFL